VLSGLYLFIAAYAPRYDRVICNYGRFTVSSAAFWTAILAKSIEMSFVTVIVALLSQSLSRRACGNERRQGVTLAEMSMRSWIVQLGTLISKWESVRYAGCTLFGIVSALSAIFAMLYTSASTALVQPQLKFWWLGSQRHERCSTSFVRKSVVLLDQQWLQFPYL
jgi:hypothetical protein